MSEQTTTTIDEVVTNRRLEVAQQIIAVDDALANAFTHKGRRYLPAAIAPALLEVKQAFDDAEYDHAEHLASVIQRMIARERVKFAADPPKWIKHQQQREEAA